MKLSIDLGRWTTTKAALAVAGALAIAGAVGTALAISPVVEAPFKWQGGVEAVGILVNSVFATEAYVVPQGRSFLLTDIVASNVSFEGPGFLHISSGSAGVCTSVNHRMTSVAIPESGALHIALQTGIGFSAGQTVCLARGTSNVVVNLRGFLFTPVPTS